MLQPVDKFTYPGSTLSRAVLIDDEINTNMAKPCAWIFLQGLPGGHFFFYEAAVRVTARKCMQTQQLFLVVGFRKASNVDQPSIVAGYSIKESGRLKATAMIKKSVFGDCFMIPSHVDVW